MGVASRVAAEAQRAVAEAIGASYDRRRFTVSKFGRHADGYFHARVVVDGKPFYFHRRFGSWLAPGRVGNLDVLKEPEGLLGPLGREVKFGLAEKARAMQTHEQREEAARNAANKRASGAAKDGGGDGKAVGEAGVRDPGDHGDAPVTVQPD